MTSTRLSTVPRDERGASAVEYGLLISGIAAIIALTIYAFGGGIASMFQETCSDITTSAHGTSC